MTTISHCPLCDSTALSPHLDVKDHTVSQETFHIVKCDNCSFHFTSPVPDDLGRYYESSQYISHSNKANSVTDILYKLARTLTLRWKTNLIIKYNLHPARTLLDYGCGTGAFLAAARQASWNVSGVEPAKLPRETASEASQGKILPTIEQLGDDKFAIITLWHVLEHVPNLHEILGQLYARLEDTGTIFIAVPNHHSKDAGHYNECWAAYDTPRHLWHFSKADMQNLLTQHHLKIEQIVPMKLDAYYVSILSEKYKRGSKSAPISSLIHGLFNGYASNRSAATTNEYSSLIYIARK